MSDELNNDADAAVADSPAFRHEFAPGEMLLVEDLHRIEQYLPRRPEEPDDRYLARACRLGLALTISSEEVAGEGAMHKLKQRLADATARHLPLVRLVGTRPTPPRGFNSAEREDAKTAALAAAREKLG
jgi:hypothetical protein